jgi:hypothetical protein
VVTSYAIVPVAAVADTVVTSATSFKTIASVDDEPENVCVAVKVLAALTTGMLAPASVVAPVPPEATGSGVVSVVVPATLKLPVFVSPGVVIPADPSIITGIFYSNILVAVA